MLVRPSRCQRTAAMCRLPSSYSRSSRLRTSTSLLRSPEPLRSQSLPATRRLLTTRQTLRPWRRSGLQTSLGHPPERSLATAVDDYGPSYRSPALSGLPPSSPFPQYKSNGPAAPMPLWKLRSQDVSNPLVVYDPLTRPTKSRITSDAVPGEMEDAMAMFKACVEVGRVDRAAIILRRLAKMLLDDDLDPIEYHNAYFRASLDRRAENPDSKAGDDLHKWYELQIHAQGVQPTPTTIALMLKASLVTTQGSRRERLVQRYMGMVSPETALEVLYTEDILNENDIATVTSLCQTAGLLPSSLPLPTSMLDDVDADIPFESEPLPAAEPQSVSDLQIPDVLETPQKSSGLRNLKETLKIFSELPEGHDISQLSVDDRREIQREVERGCVAAAVRRWKEDNDNLKKMGLNTSLSTASLNARLYEWHTALEAFIKKDLAQLEASETAMPKTAADRERCMYGPVLKQSTPSRLAAVTIISVLSSLATKGIEHGVSLSIAVLTLAKLVQNDILLQQRVENQDRRYKASPKLRPLRQLRLAQSGAQSGAQSRSNDEGSAKAQDNVIDPSQFEDTAWPVTLRTKVGATLLSALLQTAKVDVKRTEEGTDRVLFQRQQAFTRMSQFKLGKKTGMIIPNQVIVDLMKKEPRGDVLARHLPMVVEPAPWQEFDKGGYLEYSMPLVRTKYGDKDQIIYSKAALARGDMTQITKGLDVLGKTAWRINKNVFSVQLEAWNRGEEIANFPPLDPDIPIPEEPPTNADPVVRRAWTRKVKAVENEMAGLRSVRCFINLQMEIARSFRDQTFYFPHNLDFRGRAYPMSTYLNHMGADNTRGLLLFAKGKELGEEGLRWLKVQLANVYGFDKASFEEREQFATDNLDKILDSANNPFDGTRWWLEAEDPWQCLAACHELKAALECPDPTKFVSHLPIHQDGTCNGLQHYAALGGDTWGAQQVNLAPGTRPADVYSAVADVVRESIIKDAQEGVQNAILLKDKITRKVVKQTVMTNVYGVTFEGARRQVKKQLDDLFPEMREEPGWESTHLAYYIAKKIFLAMGSMFRGAHDIQYWLGEIGSRVCSAVLPEQIDHMANEGTASKPRRSTKTNSQIKSRSTNAELAAQMRQTIVWTTPLRMPVAQPYRKADVRNVQTCLQELQLVSPDRFDPVDKRKQLQAFPPNFIHSLDASHMLLSALQCDSLGLTFAAVHDSFWTHACDVKVMSKALRDSFVRIHSEDVIGRLSSEFEARYRGALYLTKVTTKTKLGREISKWRSQNKMDSKQEMFLEKKRQDLLNSTDPTKVAEGEAMVTPASLYAELAPAWQSKQAAKDSSIVGLGEIPASAMTAAEAKEMSDIVADEDLAAADIAEDAPIDDELAADSIDEPLEDEEENSFDKAINKTWKKKPGENGREGYVSIWVPLTFPEIPAKGDFDVSVLKSSDYFFS